MPLHDPAELLGLGYPPVDEPLVRLLRAAGTDEATVACASDYDRFAALAAALPLAPGHPQADRVGRLLREATGEDIPLCPHTAPYLWAAWVERHGVGAPVHRPPRPATPCPHCRPASPVLLSPAAVTSLPDPLAVSAATLADWSAALAAALPAGVPASRGPAADGPYALLHLSETYAFARPDPYHAAEALATSAAERSAQMEDLLLSQALRVLGEAAKARGVTLLLCGGSPTAVIAALTYLSSCDRLPAVIYLPDDPADAAAVSGLSSTVRVGMTRAGNHPAAKDALATLAAATPIGTAVLLADDPATV